MKEIRKTNWDLENNPEKVFKKFEKHFDEERSPDTYRISQMFYKFFILFKIFQFFQNLNTFFIKYFVKFYQNLS